MTRRVAFPPLGLLSLVAEKYLQALGVDTLSPPPTSQRTLDLGARNTPEGLCIPCRLLYGNYLEAAEQGATDIIMLGGPGTCRLGYSATQQAQRLRESGFDIRPHTLDLLRLRQDFLSITQTFAEGWRALELIEPIRYLLGLLDLTDALETWALKVRAREKTRGATEQALGRALAQLSRLQDRQHMEAEQDDILGEIWAVEQDHSRPVLRVGLVGDVYTILTPYLNHNLEVQLGRMGVEVQRWFRYTGRISLPLPLPLRQDRSAQARRAGSRYLGRDVGGFARSTVGEAALMAQEDVDGFVHVAPFNCTPEIVAQSALVALQRERGTPVLNLSFDEQTGKAGLATRLEAFVDMLRAARKRRT